MNDFTPLIRAVLYRTTQAVDTLLEEGEDPDSQDIQGYTALMYAVSLVHIPKMESLLAAGANPDIQNIQGDTALTIAAANNSKGIIDRLRTVGADPSIKNNDGYTYKQIYKETHKAVDRFDDLIENFVIHIIANLPRDEMNNAIEYIEYQIMDALEHGRSEVELDANYPFYQPNLRGFPFVPIPREIQRLYEKYSNAIELEYRRRYNDVRNDTVIIPGIMGIQSYLEEDPLYEPQLIPYIMEYVKTKKK
jgi:hypothetical protein